MSSYDPERLEQQPPAPIIEPEFIKGGEVAVAACVQEEHELAESYKDIIWQMPDTNIPDKERYISYLRWDIEGEYADELRSSIATRLATATDYESRGAQFGRWISVMENVADEIRNSDTDADFKKMELVSMMLLGNQNKDIEIEMADIVIGAGQAELWADNNYLRIFTDVDSHRFSMTNHKIRKAIRIGQDPNFNKDMADFEDLDHLGRLVAFRTHTEKQTRLGKHLEAEAVDGLTKSVFQKQYEDLDANYLQSLGFIGPELIMLKRANPEIADRHKFKQDFFRLRGRLDGHDVEILNKLVEVGDDDVARRLVRTIDPAERMYYGAASQHKPRLCEERTMEYQADKEKFLAELELDGLGVPEEFLKGQVNEILREGRFADANLHLMEVIAPCIREFANDHHYLGDSTLEWLRKCIFDIGRAMEYVNPANMELLKEHQFIKKFSINPHSELLVQLLRSAEPIDQTVCSKFFKMLEIEDSSPESEITKYSFHAVKTKIGNKKEEINDVLKGWVDFFEGVDMTDVVNVTDILLDTSAFKIVPYRFHPEHPSDHNDVAKKLIEKGSDGTDMFYANLDNFRNLDQEVAESLLGVPHGGVILSHNMESFSGLSDSAINRVALTDGAYVNKLYQSLEELDGFSVTALLQETYAIFGENLSSNSVNAVKAILEGDLSADILEGLGINVSGRAGLSQLNNALMQFSVSLFETGEVSSDAIDNPVVFDYLRGVVRLNDDEREYGSGSSEELKRILSLPEQKLKPYYTKGLISVNRNIETDNSEAELEMPIDSKEVFIKYLGLMKDSAEGEFDNHFIRGSINARIQKLDKGIESVQARITKDGSTEKLLNSLESLKKQRDEMSTLRIKDERDVLNNFELLSRYKELHDSLRGALFRAGSKTEHFSLESAIESFEGDTGSIDNISKMKNIVQHNLIQETLEKIMKPEDILAVRKVLSTRALDHAINFYQNNTESSSNTTTFSLLPTRGALMELSGHIGDICWASEYDSIAQEYPNTTAVIMVKNPDNKNRRFVGASLFVETESTDGEKLLVIRGLNPLETEINMLNQKSFVDNFTDYARKIADDSGRKLAIVVDGHSGGAATNRPQLFNYLNDLKTSLQKVKINDPSTTINTYNISDVTYLI